MTCGWKNVPSLHPTISNGVSTNSDSTDWVKSAYTGRNINGRPLDDHTFNNTKGKSGCLQNNKKYHMIPDSSNYFCTKTTPEPKQKDGE